MKPLFRYAFVLSWCALLTAYGHGQELHLISPETMVQQPVSSKQMQMRVQQAAVQYQKYGQVSRVAFYDIGYPKDAAEYADMNGYAVVLVVALSQIAGELPPKHLFLRQANSRTELKQLTSASSKGAEDTLVSSVLGKYRWEGLYLFPISAGSSGVELVMDYAINRSGFILNRFDGTPAVDYPLTSPSGESPPEKVLIDFIRREYPGFTEKIAKPAGELSSIK